MEVEEAKKQVAKLQKFIKEAEEPKKAKCQWHLSYLFHELETTKEVERCILHDHFRERLVNRRTKIVLKDWVEDEKQTKD